MPRVAPLFAAVLAVAPFARPAEILRGTPPLYVCRRAPVPPVVDGRLDEAAWRDAVSTDDFGDILGARGPRPARRTSVKLLWDDDHLYVGATLEEPDLVATVTTRDAVIFQDNDFEVFLDPKGDGRSYLELEINALNTVWDLFLTRPYREGGHALHDWDIRGLKSAVALQGTLNDPRDRDRGWTVEIAIPWTAITGLSTNPRVATAPVSGDEMRINFSRVEWEYVPDKSSTSGYVKRRDAAGKTLPEANLTWAPMPAIDMHEPGHWGVLRFSDAPPGSRTGAAPDPDEPVRAELFRLYREQREYRAQHGRFAADLSAWVSPEDMLRGVKWAPCLRLENAGGTRYAIVAVSPFTGDQWTIVDDGVVTRKRAADAGRRDR